MHVILCVSHAFMLIFFIMFSIFFLYFVQDVKGMIVKFIFKNTTYILVFKPQSLMNN